MIKQSGDYIAVRIPDGAHDFELGIPYSNEIHFLTGEKIMLFESDDDSVLSIKGSRYFSEESSF
jgi:hypothetical protein